MLHLLHGGTLLLVQLLLLELAEVDEADGKGPEREETVDKKMTLVSFSVIYWIFCLDDMQNA